MTFSEASMKASKLESKAKTICDLSKASNIWRTALKLAKLPENQKWCIARAEFCKSMLAEDYLSRK